MTESRVCLWCGETIDWEHGEAWTTVGTSTGLGYQHWECSLRVVTGGIGHLIAHHFWCTQQHDPDGGLTKRQSARLVAAYVEVIGVENIPFGSDDSSMTAPEAWEGVPRFEEG